MFCIALYVIHYIRCKLLSLEEFIARNCTVWPIFILINVITALMVVLHYDPDSNELPGIDYFRNRGILQIFVSIRDVLRFCGDTDTIVLRMFGGIGWNRTNMGKIPLQFTRMYWKILHESLE